MIKTLQNTLKQDKEKFTVPRSVQDTIPIRRIWQDGVFQFGSKFSKSIRFSDINYAIASKEDKTAMFLNYSELLNALDTGSTTKITINNKRINRQNFEETILIPYRDDFLDGYRAEYNTMLTDKVTDAVSSVVQERYITVSTHKKNIEEARTFFDRVTNDITSRLSKLDSRSEELDATERLRILHDFYRVGEETDFRFDLRDSMKKGRSYRDAICPDSMEFKKDHFVMGDKYGRVLFLKEYASYIKDSMINELTELNRTLMLSIDVIPVPTDEAVREKFNKKLRKKFEKDFGANEYPHYDNYDAIEVPFTECIPSDYDGAMGVPITFLDKYNPVQFEILDTTERWSNMRTKKYSIEEYSAANDLNATWVVLTEHGPVKGYKRLIICPKKGGND